MDQWKELEYFGAVGKSVDRIRNLKDSFREADKVFASRFTEKPKQILSIADLQVQKEEGEVPVKGFVQVGKTRTVLEKFLNNGTKEEVNDFVKHMQCSWKRITCALRWYGNTWLWISVL